MAGPPGVPQPPGNPPLDPNDPQQPVPREEPPPPIPVPPILPPPAPLTARHRIYRLENDPRFPVRLSQVRAARENRELRPR